MKHDVGGKMWLSILLACGDKTDDTEPTILYPPSDVDQDGFSDSDGDCDDNDPNVIRMLTIHPMTVSIRTVALEMHKLRSWVCLRVLWTFKMWRLGVQTV